MRKLLIGLVMFTGVLSVVQHADARDLVVDRDLAVAASVACAKYNAWVWNVQWNQKRYVEAKVRFDLLGTEMARGDLEYSRQVLIDLMGERETVDNAKLDAAVIVMEASGGTCIKK